MPMDASTNTRRKNQLILNLRMKCSRQSVTEENVASRMRQAHPPLELLLSIARGHDVHVSHYLSLPTLHETSMMQFSDYWLLKF
ncbi:hypothetical protein H5410_059186 [Solanum commersonii]|uniref:Uncharacterized protein n=1 Tax=Solanum commersonii TaxID=4109 RepID=A0A9J5W276_SOLCO|nr:hypothetical protein H5410_059186 [Solanum commersonii]